MKHCLRLLTLTLCATTSMFGGEISDRDAQELLLQKTVALDPLNANAYFNLSVYKFKRGDYAQAVTDLQTALSINPGHPNALYNMAYMLRTMGHNQQAIPFYQMILTLKPDYDHAHLGLAKAYLATGDFERGWKEFQWRLEQRTYFKYLPTPEQLKNKRILLRYEWGLGDMMQFIRYAQLVKQAGATVIVETVEPLMPLFKRCPYIDELIPHNHENVMFHHQIPMMSLPLVFGTTATNMPASIPYLYADPDLVAAWKEKLKDVKEFKIGICWQAKKIFLEDQLPTRRSLPLKQFEPVARIPGVRLYNLQVGAGVEQLHDALGFKVHEFGADFDTSNGAFMDTAAVMEHLDLIISADTSVVHLAGALGRPVWVLLPYSAEWRWMTERTDTPWYPTMRLFRQQEVGNWTTVITEVCKELKKIVVTKQKTTDPIELFTQAVAYVNAGDKQTALTIFKELADTIIPTMGQAHYNTAYLMKELGQRQESIPYYKQALALHPTNDTYFGLAQAYLTHENFVDGWPAWEQGRMATLEKLPNRLTSVDNIRGKTIHIMHEWGHGDMLQMIRYAQLLKKKGATIVVSAPRSLIPLLSLCNYIDEIIPMGTQLTRTVDYQIPVMSLPMLCESPTRGITYNTPYLRADEKLVKQWENTLPHDTFNIGICWEGSHPAKFIPLEQFMRLANCPGVRVYSLQKSGNAHAQLQAGALVGTIHEFDGDFDTKHGAFMDTAAVMQHLDLIITTDTSVAHLAGGMGRPTWLLLLHAADWRWFTDRTDSPWYPTMRLFRQPRAGDWKSVFDDVLHELSKLMHP